MVNQATKQDIALMAHLMRRAGFGARYDELVERAQKGYEATVDELLNPDDNSNGLDLDLTERCFIEWSHFTRGVPEYFAWRLINSRAQLEEKMVLFWHSIFCTADSKVQCYPTHYDQLEMFRKNGMGSFRDMLLEISKDPAMIFFLDNCLSHKESINENYGRELLELFSLGVGKDGDFNYSRGRRKGVRPGLHRLDDLQPGPRSALRPLFRPVPLRSRRPRRRREDLPGRDRPLQRRRTLLTSS